MQDDGLRFARNELFQELKPVCVRISQLALQDDGTHRSFKALVESSARLLAILEHKCRQTDGVFDEKLADYVFFPLSQILRSKQKFTDQLSELTIKCIQILLKFGWKNSISLDLAKQLLIWLTFVITGVPGNEAKSVPEELKIEAHGAIAALFDSLNHTSGGSTTFTESDMLPPVGHCISVLLDGITDGASLEVQFTALSALDQLWSCLENMETLLKFLPGAVSALAKCLTPTTKVRRSQKILVKALEVLGHILVSSLNDIRATSIRGRSKYVKEALANDQSHHLLTPSWLEATSGQVKLILSNIIRLRDHEKLQVRKALNIFCISILDNCHDTLSGSARILIETCMTLNGIDSEDSLYNYNTTLTDLALIRTDYAELVKDIMYDWVSSLPRKMQGSDEQVKTSAIEQLSKAQEYFVKLNLKSAILDEALRNSLRDSVTVSLEAIKSPKVLQESAIDLNCLAVSTSVIQGCDSRVFPPIIMYRQGEKETRASYFTLIASLPSIDLQVGLASEMLEYAKCASGPSFIAAFWLSLQAIKAAWARNQDVEEFSEVYAPSRNQLSVEQDLFSYAYSMLSSTDEEEDIDWRPKTIALEVLAETAHRMKQSYRLELVDTLYPVVQLLGSPNLYLREHAITCLNVISFSCGYKNTSDLIIDNVDYMVNAISLKLNTFDIAPQTPQVLVMMVRLTGPRLLPYLDDILGSIFAALANFHGYQRLVDSLFSVLAEIVSVGSKSGQHHVLASESGPSHVKQQPPVPTIESICATLSRKAHLDADPMPHEPFPHAPWKAAKSNLDADDADAEISTDLDEHPNEPLGYTEVQRPAPTKVYTMLQSITRLCQYHLTSPSPVLRSRLLGLIRDAACVLSPDEDAFLPLVNDLWPVIIKRLYDSEPFVCITACDTIADLCRCAGDFLTTRFRTEWPDLLRLAHRARETVDVEKRRGGARGKFSQASQIWEALVQLLCAVVGHVAIQDEMFEDVLEIFAPLIGEREDIRSVMEAINTDAVWLAMYEMRLITAPSKPVFEGHEFVDLYSYA